MPVQFSVPADLEAIRQELESKLNEAENQAERSLEDAEAAWIDVDMMSCSSEFVREIRYREGPIRTEEDWAAATPIDNVPPPTREGYEHTVPIRGLKPSTVYTVASRLWDREDGVPASGIETASAKTLAFDPVYAPGTNDVDSGPGA